MIRYSYADDVENRNRIRNIEPDLHVPCRIIELYGDDLRQPVLHIIILFADDDNRSTRNGF